MSAHDAVSPQQFGFLQVHPDEWSQKTLDTAMHPAVERTQRRIRTDVPIHTGQEHIYPSTVDDFVAHPGKRAAASRNGDPAEVYDVGGKLYMGDGHHRLAAARKTGQKTIRVDYWKAP